jgi:hypothetical protein
MILCSRILAITAAVLVVLAAIVFFAMDVRKSWRILRGKKITPSRQSTKQGVKQKQKPVALERMDTQTVEITKRLQSMEEKTKLLIRQKAPNPSGGQPNIGTDITYINTGIML